jgi:acid phosphatase (class A)
MMSLVNYFVSGRLLPVLASVVILAGCAGYDGGSRPAVIESNTGYAMGYLAPQSVPDSLALIPPPPAAGSVAFALDEEYSRKSFALRNTTAWTLAASDADLKFPHAAEVFSCALGAPVTEKDTPYLYVMMRRTLSDVHYSVNKPKKRYQRPRPFLVNKEPICTPEDEALLGKEGSYPSGHNTVGMVWSLILAEISPERADVIFMRGRVFGLNRVVCNVHWYSDTLQGRFVGADVVARLHADPVFRADLEAARAEIKTARAKGLKPTRDCVAEAAAIALQRSLLQ